MPRFGNNTPDDRCRDVAEKMMYIWGIAKALSLGWDALVARDYPIGESVARVEKIVADLHKEGMIADADLKLMETNFRELKELPTEPHGRLLAGLLKDNILDLSINSVCDCKAKYPNRVE